MASKDRGIHKPKEEIVEGEIIAELPDETLVTLPPVPGERSEHLGVPRIAPEPVDSGRRQFIIRLALGGAAALALGGSAALLSQSRRQPGIVVLPNGAQVKSDGTLDVARLVQQVNDLETQLAAAKVDHDSLTSQLQTANAELDQLRPQVQNAQALNKLWQALDDVGLDDLLSGALQVAVTAFASVTAVAGLLKAGIAAGQSALDSFSQSLPGPKAGVQWLQGEAQSLSASLQDLETQVQQAVEPVKPYAQMIANFVQWVLERLPFGVGSKAQAGLNAMQAIVGDLPGAVDQINQSVLDPLAVWLGDDSVRNLSGILLDPISVKVIDPARSVGAQLDSFQDAFQHKLVAPVQSALDQRATIRKQIRAMQARIGMNVG